MTVEVHSTKYLINSSQHCHDIQKKETSEKVSQPKEAQWDMTIKYTVAS